MGVFAAAVDVAYAVEDTVVGSAHLTAPAGWGNIHSHLQNPWYGFAPSRHCIPGAAAGAVDAASRYVARTWLQSCLGLASAVVSRQRSWFETCLVEGPRRICWQKQHLAGGYYRRRRRRRLRSNHLAGVEEVLEDHSDNPPLFNVMGLAHAECQGKPLPQVCKGSKTKEDSLYPKFEAALSLSLSSTQWPRARRSAGVDGCAANNRLP